MSGTGSAAAEGSGRSASPCTYQPERTTGPPLSSVIGFFRRRPFLFNRSASRLVGPSRRVVSSRTSSCPTSESFPITTDAKNEKKESFMRLPRTKGFLPEDLVTLCLNLHPYSVLLQARLSPVFAGLCCLAKS